MKGRLKSAVSKGILVLVTPLLVLVAMEAMIRIIATGTLYIFEAKPHTHDQLGWQLKPGFKGW